MEKAENHSLSKLIKSSTNMPTLEQNLIKHGMMVLQAQNSEILKHVRV